MNEAKGTMGACMPGFQILTRWSIFFPERSTAPTCCSSLGIACVRREQANLQINELAVKQTSDGECNRIGKGENRDCSKRAVP